MCKRTSLEPVSDVNDLNAHGGVDQNRNQAEGKFNVKGEANQDSIPLVFSLSSVSFMDLRQLLT